MSARKKKTIRKPGSQEKNGNGNGNGNEHRAANGGASGAETILAVASAPGLSAQAIVRLSGPQALAAVERLAVARPSPLGAARRRRGVRLTVAVEGASLEVWANVYRAPRSYTREDVVELFVCGSPPVLHLLATALLGGRDEGDPLVRWARPGEFTLRAFLSGRIDLSQAEAVASLIGATGEAEARAARRGLRGELRDHLERLATSITDAIAILEAGLDFPDEDLPEIAPAVLGRRLDAVVSDLRALRAACARGSGVDGTLRVALAGFPNAGKSSLLNAILGREAAIATPVPGTTRDPVRGVTVVHGRRVEWVDLAGTYAIDTLIATAGGEADSGASGCHQEDELIGRLLRRLSRAEIEAADVLLWVIDGAADVRASLAECRRLAGKRVVLVLQKVDLLEPREREQRKRALAAAAEHGACLVSARSGEGLTELVTAVLRLADDGADDRARRRLGATPRFLVSAHQQAAMEAAAESLDRAREVLGAGSGYEFVAADLRDALRALEDLTGRVTSEAILEHVFSRFCIGK